MKYVDGWRNYVEAMEMKKAGYGRKPHETATWKPPSRGRYKANFDASVGRDGKKGVGVVVQNDKGDIITVACRSP